MSTGYALGGILVRTMLATGSAASLVAACSQASAGASDADDLPRLVSVAEIEARLVEPEILSFGTITYFRKIDLSADSSGTIEGLQKREGAEVHAGETLAVVRNLQYDISRQQAEATLGSSRAALTLAEARLWEGQLAVESRLIGIQKAELELDGRERELEEARAELADKRELLAVGGVAQEVVNGLESRVSDSRAAHAAALYDLELRRIGLRDRDLLALGFDDPQDDEQRLAFVTLANTQTLRAEVAVARSQVLAARAELDSIDQLARDASVISPIAGIVGAKYLETGERAAAGTKILTIVDVSRVLGIFPIAEQEVHLLTENSPVEVTVDALPGAALSGRVLQIAAVGDPQSGRFTVQVLMDNPFGRLRPGMFARARAVVGSARSLLELPASALISRNARAGAAFVVRNARLNRVEVLLAADPAAASESGVVEVLRGVVAGDLVVDRPTPLLRDGMQVRIQ